MLIVEDHKTKLIKNAVDRLRESYWELDDSVNETVKAKYIERSTKSRYLAGMKREKVIIDTQQNIAWVLEALLEILEDVKTDDECANSCEDKEDIYE